MAGPGYESPEVALDEAGNTGQDLLNAEQPVYALGAVYIDADRAASLVQAALHDRQAKELKFMTLRRRAYGPPLLSKLFHDAGLAPDDARVSVVHKPWMLVAKMVDVLVEPAMHAKGLTNAFYGTEAHINMTNTLFFRAAAAMGADTWRDLQHAFATVVRSPGGAPPPGQNDAATDPVDRFITAIRRARLACSSGTISMILDVMPDSRERLEADVVGHEDELDPAPTSVAWQAWAWTKMLNRFTFVHDDADAVRRWEDILLLAGKANPGRIQVGERVLEFPTGLSTLRFARSVDDPRVQLADVLAGSCAWIYGALAGLRTEDDLVSRLKSAGLSRLIEHFLGPPLEEAAVARLTAR